MRATRASLKTAKMPQQVTWVNFRRRLRFRHLKNDGKMFEPLVKSGRLQVDSRRLGRATARRFFGLFSIWNGAVMVKFECTYASAKQLKSVQWWLMVGRE